MLQEQPFFSIIIPTRDRSEQLSRCLQALTVLTYPRERFEVIIVDDGGRIPVSRALAPFRAKLDLKLLIQRSGGPAAARNAGAAQAKGRFLAFTDDDCTPASDWLSALAARFAVAPERVFGGQVLNALPDNLCSSASQLVNDYLYAYFNARPDDARFFTSNNLAVSSDSFRKIRGFDTGFPFASEDRDLCDRWLHAGYRMSYAPEVVIHHAHPLTLGRFCYQHHKYGRGKFRFDRMRARRGHGCITIESASFYIRLLRHPLTLSHGPRAWAEAGLVILSQVALVSGFLWEGLAQAGRTVALGPSKVLSTEPTTSRVTSLDVRR